MLVDFNIKSLQETTQVKNYLVLKKFCASQINMDLQLQQPDLSRKEVRNWFVILTEYFCDKFSKVEI